MSYLHNDPELQKGIIPIQKKFMQRNQSFALEFREGFVFGRVIRRRLCVWKPWPLIDSNGTAIDILPSATQAELRFRDPRNVANDILFLDTSTDSGLPWFFHGAFGIKPQYVSMYLRYPEGDIIPGKFPNIDPIRPAFGDQISDLNGINSPYEQPTDFHEVIIQPKVRIASEYYNQDEVRRHQPVINILFCLYWAQIYKSHTHPTLISDIALKRYEGAKATFLTCGFGNQPNDLGPSLIKDWDVTPLSLDEATALASIRRS